MGEISNDNIRFDRKINKERALFDGMYVGATSGPDGSRTDMERIRIEEQLESSKIDPDTYWVGDTPILGSAGVTAVDLIGDPRPNTLAPEPRLEGSSLPDSIPDDVHNASGTIYLAEVRIR